MVRLAEKASMRTSATCRPTEQRARGFTLLELLVVLAILGMVAAIAIPGAIRTIGAWQQRALLDDVVIKVRSLPVLVRASGQPLVLGEMDGTDADQWDVLELPEGWAVIAEQPLRVEANGACSDARLLFDVSGSRRTLAVDMPFCDARWTD